MPQCKIESLSESSSWSLWRVDENLEELWQMLNPGVEAQFEFHAIHHPQKKLEWLASRLVIKNLVEYTGVVFKGIYKDAFGKPHLNRSSFHISIAHCFPYAVGALHQTQPIGIDIERPRNKLLRIRDRFLNDTEAAEAGSNLHRLCQYWTGKEVIYKIYGRKKLVFRDHIHINLSNGTSDLSTGFINFDQVRNKYHIKIQQFEDHYIAIGA